MKIVYSITHRMHNPLYELYDGAKIEYAESSARADSIIETLNSNNLGPFIEPESFDLSHVLKIHQAQYVDFVRTSSNTISQNELLFPSYYISDTYAPITAGTYVASIAAIDIALTGAQELVNGERVVYSLCRPPGHHAEHSSMGGYCYFNNAAISAEYLAQHGRVAILDIDLHHGNGTQSAFYGRPDVLYVSIHADPTSFYPYRSGFNNEEGAGLGVGKNINYPMPLRTTNNQYFKILRKAITDIQNFNPDYLIVSAGFDTFMYDPIGGFNLTLSAYTKIGALINDLGLPTLIIQEGGYNIEHLGEITNNFLTSFT